MSEELAVLKKKVQILERELQSREQDIALYQQELVKVNEKLKVLLSKVQNNFSSVEEIYKALVPTRIPTVSGFEFSNRFVPSPGGGSDYFDVFQHKDKSRFGLILSSSSSYVMSALILSSLLRLNEEMICGVSPSEITQSIAKESDKKVEKSDSSSLFYAFFDRRRYQFRYSLVGSICALFYDYESRQVKLLKPSCKTFGEFLNLTDVKDQILDLGPKDRLILCSPGTFTAKNANNEIFGKERLFQVIVDFVDQDVHQLRNSILYAVDNFVSEPQSDMTVIVAKVSDNVIKMA